MSEMLFNLIDTRLQLWRGDELVLESPGYALLQGKQYLFGEPARSQARLQPRNIHHRYWQQLDTEPLQPAFGPSRHSADLVHAQLMDIHQQATEAKALIIAAPGSMQSAQLSLLLGIIDQCPFDAVGLVDRAVASCSGLALVGEACHIELHLNQALVTRLGWVDGQLQRLAATPIPGCGWLAVQESLAQAIADSFIRQTRYDPRRLGGTEQELYNQLPPLLSQLEQLGEKNLEFTGNQARIDRATLAEKCAPLWQRIAATITPGARVVLAPGMNNLPGLREQFDTAMQLDEHALPRAVYKHRDALRGDGGGLHFITRLPAEATTAENAQKPEPEPAKEVTPAPEPCQYRIDVVDGVVTVEPGQGRPPRLNGSALTTSTRLQPGDVLELGDDRILQVLNRTGEDGT